MNVISKRTVAITLLIVTLLTSVYATDYQVNAAVKKPAKVKQIKIKYVKKSLKIQKKNYTATKKFNIRWKKVKGASGYQIVCEYPEGNKRRSVKRNYIKKWKLTFYASGVGIGNAVQIKVRAYKKVNGKRVYGKWSALKQRKAFTKAEYKRLKKAGLCG